MFSKEKYITTAALICLAPLLTTVDKASAQLMDADSVWVGCQDIAPDFCDTIGGGPCSSPCHELDIREYGYKAIKEIDVTCEESGGYLQVCQAYIVDYPDTNWVISNTNCVKGNIVHIKEPSTTQPLTTGEFFLIDECGCCKIELTIIFNDLKSTTDTIQLGTGYYYGCDCN